MNATDWLVVLGGLGAILWVNWYFFLAGRSVATAAAPADGTQEVTIGVRGGYDPAQIRVRAGAPVRLVFDRQETSGCSEEVVIPDFGIRPLPPGAPEDSGGDHPARGGIVRVHVRHGHAPRQAHRRGTGGVGG